MSPSLSQRRTEPGGLPGRSRGPEPAPPPCLVAREVVVKQGSSILLDRVSLELAPGELIVLLGPNGSGKTTLLEVLLGWRQPDRGMVRLNGVDVTRLGARERARRLTLVAPAQTTSPVLRVRELVELGRNPHLGRLARPGEHDQEVVATALEVTATASLASRLVGTVSSGERQRAELARAFAQQPRVLLLDEPTANLDLYHTLHTLGLLRAFVRSGGAAVVVLHDLTLAARWADRVLVMSAGRVVSTGTPEEVLEPRLLAEVFGVETRVARDAEGRIEQIVLLGLAGCDDATSARTGARRRALGLDTGGSVPARAWAYLFHCSTARQEPELEADP